MKSSAWVTIMGKLILDISHHESVKDWSKLKESVSFLVFKATQGTTFLDPNCYKTIKNCEKYGVPYWLYCFLNKGNELAQAKYMVEKTKGEVGKYFVGYCIDAEMGNTAKNVKSALDYVKKHSKKTMLYTAHHHYDMYRDLVKNLGDNCAWWEPRYSTKYKPHDGVDLWQYSETYKCSYISGEVDINRIYGDKYPLAWYLTPDVKSVAKETKVNDSAKAIQKLTDVSKAEVGYLEKKSNKDLDSKTANAGKANYTKYGKWIGANGDYWCASFLSWIFCKAFGNELGKKLLCGSYSAACETIRQNFKKKGQYKTVPKAGDVIFFTGSRHSGANHIGYVYKVDDGKVFTIEGNTSGASGVVDNGGGVAKKSYTLNNSRILGYGRPPYNQFYDEILESLTEKKDTTAPKGTSVYPKCDMSLKSLVDAMKSVGEKDTSLRHRQEIAQANGIKDYSGSALQNIEMLDLLKSGKLVKP